MREFLPLCRPPSDEAAPPLLGVGGSTRTGFGVVQDYRAPCHLALDVSERCSGISSLCDQVPPLDSLAQNNDRAKRWRVSRNIAISISEDFPSPKIWADIIHRHLFVHLVGLL